MLVSANYTSGADYYYGLFVVITDYPADYYLFIK